MRRRARLQRPFLVVLILIMGIMAMLASPGIAYQRPGAYEKVSLGSDGSDTKWNNGGSAMTPDGQYVVFCSPDDGLAQGDNNPMSPVGNRGWDVFVRDRVAKTTEIASATNTGAAPIYPWDAVLDQPLGPPNGGVCDPEVGADISHSGRYVAFNSNALNMAMPPAGLTGIRQTPGEVSVFVRDMKLGTTEMINVNSDGIQSDGTVGYPIQISGDGRYVVFTSASTNLEGGPAVSGGGFLWEQVYLHDRKTGKTSLISKSHLGGASNHQATGPAMNKTGRFVTFLRP